MTTHGQKLQPQSFDPRRLFNAALLGLLCVAVSFGGSLRLACVGVKLGMQPSELLSNELSEGLTPRQSEGTEDSSSSSESQQESSFELNQLDRRSSANKLTAVSRGKQRIGVANAGTCRRIFNSLSILSEREHRNGCGAHLRC